MMMQYLEDALSSCESLVTQPVVAGGSEWMSACQTVGNILSGMGFVEESFSWQTMALAMEPNPVNFYMATGRVYGHCQNWEKAAYFCERIIEQQPDDAEAYCRLAKVYHEMGDYKAEGETIHTLLCQQPDKANADGHYQLGKVMERHGLFPQAMRCYQQAIEQDPDFAIAYYTLSERMVKQGNSLGAVALLKQLSEQLEDDAMAHYRLGRAYRQNREFETAILSFRQALKLDPDLNWAYIGMLNSLTQLQRWDETIDSCRGILHFVGEFPWTYCFLANALAKKGQVSEAISNHQKAFELRGWARCTTHDYQFTYTWFSENIALWERHLLPLLTSERDASGLAAEASSLKMLALGSCDDSILCWLADEILRQPGDQLICFTEGVSPQLSENLAKLPDAEKVSVEIGDLPQLLANLSDSTTPDDSLFDVIFIQSDCKQADYLNTLASQAWQLLKPGGLLFFKDYHWKDPQNPTQSSKRGIDAFIEASVSRPNVLHQSHQVIVKKEGKLSA
ncbi:MAG: protein arginine N-methyltransferase [Cyanobacteria bacterium J06621_11]